MNFVVRSLQSFTLFALITSCVSPIRRPEAVKNSPLCINLEDGVTACKSTTGEYDVESPGLICTTPEGYGAWQKYVETLEKRLAVCLKSRKNCK